MTTFIWILLCLGLLAALALGRCRLRTVTTSVALLLAVWTLFAAPNGMSVIFVWLLFTGVAIALHQGGVRRRWLTGPALTWFRKALPQLTDSERTALNAGTVGWEAELFSGMPDWQQLERLPPALLSSEEQTFIDGPLQALLDHMADAAGARPDCSPPAIDPPMWNRLKADGFLGLAIPTRFGGRGFSAHARSCILARIASAPGGATLGPIVAAPNALGPAQLLLASGTEAQQAHYLPRLAAGDDIPCFAVTSERAGTDVAALTDVGVICEGEYDGKQQLGIRLNWHKRHITLAPVATLLGLAVQLRDPDGLLGAVADLGMTCVLIDARTPGVDNSRYHQPIGANFPYGPTQGTDVFVPLNAIIGGADQSGHGWRLLMEHLPIGRGLSLPSAAAGLCSRHARLASAYTRVRRQFGRPIGSFEGVEEVLARIGGHAYACESVRRTTANAVDLGQRSAIAAAIAKYHCTTRAQQVAVDSMILHAGKAACAGPANPVADDYLAVPLAATADGTNLFTRSVLILGQGGIRCHPFLQQEIKAASHPDPERALAAFDAVFPAHLGYMLTIATRALALGLSGGRGSGIGQTAGLRRYYQRINRYATDLALLADLAMAVLGDNLRHRENLSGRLGDVLSQLYIASATLQRYREDGAHRQDLPLVEWVCEDCFARIEQHLAKVLRHLPRRPAAWLAELLIFPLGRRAQGPNDDSCHRVATVLQTPGDTRDRLTAQCYRRPEAEQDVALFDSAMQAAIATAPLRKRLRRAIRRGDLHGTSSNDCVDQAQATGLLDETEVEQLRHARALHDAVIRVDSFPASATRDAAGKAA